MKVSQFIKWLETQPQDLEVCVIEGVSDAQNGAFGEEECLATETVCFDDPIKQSSKTSMCLILGVE